MPAFEDYEVTFDQAQFRLAGKRVREGNTGGREVHREHVRWWSQAKLKAGRDISEEIDETPQGRCAHMMLGQNPNTLRTRFEAVELPTEISDQLSTRV